MQRAGFVALWVVASTVISPAMAQPTVPQLIAEKPTDIIQEAPYDFFMRQGYAAAKEEDYETAARYFRNALYEVPNDRDALTAYWNMRDALRPQDKPSEALSAYDRYMERGYDATESGNYQTALNNFRQALAERPEDYYATQAARNVQTYLNRGQVQAVTTAPKFYLNELPYDRYMRLGYAAMQRDDYGIALQQFRRALEVRPNDRQALIAFWNVKDILANGPKESLSGTPEAAYDRLMRRGYDATDNQAYQRAFNYFEAALEERPGDYYATQAIRNVSSYLNLE